MEGGMAMKFQDCLSSLMHLKTMIRNMHDCKQIKGKVSVKSRLMLVGGGGVIFMTFLTCEDQHNVCFTFSVFSEKPDAQL